MPHDLETVVFQEFDLRFADADHSIARIVAATCDGEPDAIPLLTSIADDRRVATLHSLGRPDAADAAAVERAALAPFVSSWDAPRIYRTRISERSLNQSSHYRLAVTDSGINNAERSTDTTVPFRSDAVGTPVDLLMIAVPLQSFAGLLVLIGTQDHHPSDTDARDWPLPISEPLGVRIYESRA